MIGIKLGLKLGIRLGLAFVWWGSFNILSFVGFDREPVKFLLGECLCAGLTSRFNHT